MKLVIAVSMSLAGFLAGSGSAVACTFAVRHHSDQEIRKMAREAVASASAIVDGEVISPMMAGPVPDGALPVAAIKVSRTLKGRLDDEIIPVAYFSSCDVALETKGQKLRILLSGDGIFTASQGENGFEAVYERAAFNREVDLLLGSSRPTDFVDPGAPAPPEHSIP